MPAARPKPTDFTGNQRAALAKEHAATARDRANQISMASAAEEEALATQVTDYTTGANPTIIGSVEDVGVALNQEWEVIRVVEDVSPTIGVGNHYEFKAGQKYKVPRNVADHLREKNYVWGM